MVIRINIARCLHCSAEVHYPGGPGVVPPTTCPACADAGHRDAPGGCPVCRPALRRARIDATLAASLGEPVSDSERARRERTRAALAESRAAIAAGAAVRHFDRWPAAIHPAIDGRGNFTFEDDDECK